MYEAKLTLNELGRVYSGYVKKIKHYYFLGHIRVMHFCGRARGIKKRSFWDALEISPRDATWFKKSVA